MINGINNGWNSPSNNSYSGNSNTSNAGYSNQWQNNSNPQRNNMNNNSGRGVINLSKGGKINLTKETPGLKKIMFGLHWDCAQGGQYEYDLDASVFLVDERGRTADKDFIFYNNLVGVNDCVIHHGDDKVGSQGGDEDDEQISIDLDKIPSYIQKVALCISIYDANRRRQNFGQVHNAYCRMVNEETGREEVRFNLGEDFSIEIAVVVGEVYRHNGDWKFNAIGSGFTGGLEALCKNYGIDAEYR
jgi:tellurium resistance protein TerD